MPTNPLSIEQLASIPPKDKPLPSNLKKDDKKVRNTPLENSLQQFIISGELILITVLKDAAKTDDQDRIAKALVNLFELNHKSKSLVQRVIYDEINVETSEGEGVLFRTNSIASKILKSYSFIVGQAYLRNTLYNVVNELCSNDIRVEVDPARLKEGEDIDSNAERLVEFTSKFVDAICNSLENCPERMKSVCYFLRSTTEKKYPSAVNKVIGGFIFLRFFCPGVVSPENYGIVEKVPPINARRSLVLIAKNIQNMANEVQFSKGQKEPYMERFLPYLIEAHPKMTQFFKLLGSEEIPESRPRSVDVPNSVRDGSLDYLSKILVEYYEKDNLKQQYLNKGGEATWGKLYEILSQLAAQQKN